jgi:hypothetical protein
MDMDRLKAQFADALNTAGVSRVVNQKLSQFLDLGDFFFVEVVLNDASLQEAAEKAVKEFVDNQTRLGQRIDYIVRSRWNILGVDRSDTISVGGVMKAAIPFVARLESGQKVISVPVWVTESARLFLANRPLALGLSETDLLKAAVQEYLQEQLRLGGTSYWDPLKYPVADLNEAAMLFLARYGPEFYQLKWAIDDFFETVNNQSQLNSLVSRRLNLFDFEHGISELSSQLGGAIDHSHSTPTSARELFQKLDERERDSLQYYYRKQAERFAEKRRAEFPSLFADTGQPS